MNDAQVAFLCSRNHVDIACSVLTTLRGGLCQLVPTLLLWMCDLGQDGEWFASGAGEGARAGGAHAEGAAPPQAATSLLPSLVSTVAIHMLKKKKHKPVEYALTVTTM